MILKSYKEGIKKCSQLDQSNSFLLEVSCLKKIKKHYTCICDVKKKHFPKILKIDVKKFQISLSNRGFSVKDIIKKNLDYVPINIEEQLKCIIHNLKKKNIKHLDMAENGKNICINKKGTISLIDFDYVSIGDKYMSSKIERSACRFKNYDEYLEYFTNSFMVIINKVKK
jgi:thiamine kinase-like enzyme